MNHKAAAPHADRANQGRACKISFPIGDTGHGAFETMHAIELSEGRYRLNNSPFFAFDVSFGDIVSAEERDGTLVFERVIRRGGHSTYRVQLPLEKNHSDFSEIWPLFEEFGCSYEGTINNQRRYYAIDVPNADAAQLIYPLLETLEKAGAITFEEGHFCGAEDAADLNGV